MDAKIDTSELKRLAEKMAQSPDILKKAKRQAFQSAAPRLNALVDTQIGGSGKVRSWQGAYVGSGGGYAAVRPKKETYVKIGRASCRERV